MARRIYQAFWLVIATLGIAMTANANPGDYRYMFQNSNYHKIYLVLNIDIGDITIIMPSNSTLWGNYTNIGKHEYGSTYLDGISIGEVHGADFSIKKLRNYLIFNLSSVIGRTIHGAKLIIDSGSGYASNMSTSEMLRIYDIDIDLMLVQQEHPVRLSTDRNPEGIAIYNDLGSGMLYGQRIVSAADNGTQVEIGLNDAALSAITAAQGGAIGFGGALETRYTPMEFVGAYIYSAASGNQGTYSFQYSDDATNWTTAQANVSPNQAGWNSTTWPDVGARPYWRLLLENSPGIGPSLNELQMHQFSGVTSSMLSQSGLSGYTQRAITDGSTTCCGWNTDVAIAGAWLMIKPERPIAFLGAAIYASDPGYNGIYSLHYSDDAVTWYVAKTGITPNQQGWNKISWPNVGAYRYWRLRLDNTPGPGARLNELRLHEAASLKSSQLSQSGLSSYDPTFIVDGNPSWLNAYAGWDTDIASAGAWLKIDTAGKVVVHGPAIAMRLEPSQVGHATFSGIAGDRLGIGVAALTMDPTQSEGALSVKFYKFDGTLMNSFSAAGAVGAGRLNLGPLPVIGTYTLVTNPGPRLAQFDLLLSHAEVGHLIVNDGYGYFNPSRVGQFARYTFTGVQNQSYYLQFTENTFPKDIEVFVYKPNDTIPIHAVFQITTSSEC